MNKISVKSIIEELQTQVIAAADSRQPVSIRAGGSKQHLLPGLDDPPLDVSRLQGVVDYQPSELIITVRAGTALTELQAVLAEKGQMLGCEPPHFGTTATVGGAVACGWSGPRRPYAGAVRDFVLGIRCLNGRGEDLRFGGQVMKNVAGYDASRLMTGALGTLGVLLEISFKVLPLPETERHLRESMSLEAALDCMNRLAGKPYPLSAAAYVDGDLHLRLSGVAAAVDVAEQAFGFDVMPDSDFWSRLRELTLPFFADARPLWRCSLPATAALPDIDGDWLIDWGGALRWLKSTAAPKDIHQALAARAGQCVLFQGASGAARYPLIPAAQQLIQQRLRQAFDPHCIFNRAVWPCINGCDASATC
ncbi:MAG: glycolate oxidase subunit GlcE [Gammaproteobacteria bacterium]